MTMINSYFFDTYAILALHYGNTAYAKYELATAVFTKLNLFEVYTYYLRIGAPNAANGFLDKHYDLACDYDKEIIRKAARLRAGLGRGISMADAIGYAVALRLGIPFLTGDRAFEDLPNVEFVK